LPEPIHMEKRNNLGYIEDEDDLGELIGTRAGLEVWVEHSGITKFVSVVDRSVTKRGLPRVAMEIDLSPSGKAWHVDIARADSRYKGRNLAVRVYVLLMKKLGLQMQAGTSQSIGGRKIWNKLNRHRDILVFARPNSKSSKVSLVKSGRRQLSAESIDLYEEDSNAEIFAYAIG
jgi:hypothetical protein